MEIMRDVHYSLYHKPDQTAVELAPTSTYGANLIELVGDYACEGISLIITVVGRLTRRDGHCNGNCLASARPRAKNKRTDDPRCAHMGC